MSAERTEEVTMATLAIALPCLPDGAKAAKELAAELGDSRRDEFEGFHRRVGLSKEQWFLQQTPQGEVIVLVLEGDPAGAMGKFSASNEPFDVWLRDRVKRIHGVDFGQPLPAAPPELVFEG
jgi:hypothetical protein